MAHEEEPMQITEERPQESRLIEVDSRRRRTRTVCAALLGAIVAGTVISPSLQEHSQEAHADPSMTKGKGVNPLGSAIIHLVKHIEELEGHLVPNEGPRAEENEKLLRRARNEAARAGKRDPLEKCVEELVERGLLRLRPDGKLGKPDARRALSFIAKQAAGTTYTRKDFLEIGTGALSPYPDSEASQPVDCRLTMRIEFLPNPELLSRRVAPGKMGNVK